MYIRAIVKPIRGWFVRAFVIPFMDGSFVYSWTLFVDGTFLELFLIE